MLRVLAVAAALLGAAPSSFAVTLNPRGIGQVLVYPYYTANAGFATLLTVVNTSSAKALKVRFHEGYDGRVVGAFNLYLSSGDIWVGEVYDTSADGTGLAAVATNDRSCVVPAFLLPVDPGSGPARLNFSANSYSGANADGGPIDAARTHEGYVDIIEMGDVTDATQHTQYAISRGPDGGPQNCGQVSAAWQPGGYWVSNAQTDLVPPTGGLYGAASIINVAEGLMYTINATAIDGFSSAIQHTAPDSVAPDLNTGSANASGSFSAFVPFGGRLVQADYAKSEDAVSALFMIDYLFNEYVVDPGLGAMTDWIVTFPTKRFYTDNELLSGRGSTARAPFDVIFNSVNGGSSCAAIDADFFDREQSDVQASCGGFPECATALYYQACYATNALTVETDASVLGSQLRLSFGVDVLFTAGHTRLGFIRDSRGDTQSNHALTSTNGIVFTGLPALGFAATNYVNGNVTPGVLANYSGAYPHRAHVACLANGNPCQ